MERNRTSKFAAILMTVLMVFSIMPASIFAVDTTEQTSGYTITFEAGEHGVLTGETVIQADADTLWSDVVLPEITAEEGYTADGWDAVIPDTGNVDADYTFTAQYYKTKVTETESVAEPVQDETPAKPAATQSATVDGVKITVSAPEGALAEGWTLAVAKVTAQYIVESVNEALEESVEVVEYQAFDITIIAADGTVIQPDGLVSVTMENIALADAEVYHIDDNNDAQKVADVEETTAAFDTDGFSIYVVVTPAVKHYVTYTFYGYDQTTVIDTQIVKNGDTLYEPAVPDAEDGNTFKGWYDAKTEGNKFDSFGVQSGISSDSSVSLYARKAQAYYIFFLDKTGRVYSTKEATDNSDVNIADVNIPLDADEALTGWKYEDNTPVVNNTVSINGANVTLIPVVDKVVWVTFVGGAGSAYTTPVHTVRGSTISAPTNPSREGYTFKHWSETEGGSAFNFGSAINENKTLYAVWTPATNNKYTIIYWIENADNTNYAFEKTRVINNVTTGSAIVLANNDNGYSVNNINSSYKNYFTYDHYDTGKTVAADGSTIVNVYFSRNTYTFTFKSGRNTIHTFTAKYNQDISGKWTFVGSDGVSYPSTNPLVTWDPSGSSTYTARISRMERMPAENITFSRTTSNNTQRTFYYYVESLSGSGYDTYLELKHDFNYVYYNDDFFILQGFSREKAIWGNGTTWNARPGSTSGWSRGVTSLAFYYTRNSYDLEFYNVNGTAKTESVKYEAPLASYYNYVPARPSGLPSSYVFGGWYTSPACEDGTEASVKLAKMPVDGAIVYAKWSAPEFDGIAYVNIDGTQSTAFSPVKYGSTINQEELAQAKADAQANAPANYTFAGLCKDENRTIPFMDTEEIYSKLTLYPKYIDNTQYAVTYAAGTGTGTPLTDAKKYANGSYADVLKPTGLTAPSGKVFTGWSDGANIYYPGSKLLITGAMTLTAQWGDTASTVSITYYGNGGVLANTNTSYTVNAIANNALINTDANSFTRQGYTFIGWNTAENGSGQSVAENAAIRVDDIPSNRLYAQWQINTYTITPSVINGTISPAAAVTVNYGANQTVTYTANTGYKLKSVTVDGNAVDNTTYASSYTFNNIDNDHTIAVEYEKADFGYTIHHVDLSGNTLTNDTIGTAQYESTVALAGKEASITNYTVDHYGDDIVIVTDASANVSTIYYKLNVFNVSYEFDGADYDAGDLDGDFTVGAALTVAAKPAKPGYTVSSWTTSDVTVNADGSYTMPNNNVVFTATSTQIDYTVTYVDEDESTVLQAATTVHYGDAITAYTAATPTKAADATYTYAFNGWVLLSGTEGANDTVGTTNLVYKATYAPTNVKYTVTFEDYDGTELQKIDTYNNGDTATAPTDPSRAADATYTYAFAGWTPSITAIDGADQTYTATYTPTNVKYTVTFVDYDGTELQKIDTYNNGDTATAPADPTRAADATYTYAFAGWTPSITAIDGANQTYTATYTPTYIDYELTTSADANSTISAGETYHYSETATSTATFSAKEGYSITSVTVDGTALTGDALTAAIAAGEVTVDNEDDHSVEVATTVNTYTVTYYLDGVKIGNAESHTYGAAVSAKALPDKTGSTVYGWYTSATKPTDYATAVKALIPANMPANNLNYYAFSELNSYEWTINHYEVGTTTPALETADTASALFGATIELADYVKTDITGFTYDSKDADIVINTTNNTANIYYSRNEYTVTYYLDGVKIGNAESHTYGAAVAAKALPDKIGSTVYGWYTSATKPTDYATAVKALIPANMPAKNLNYYAFSEQIDYTVTYVDEDESTVLQAATTVHYGDAITAYTAATPTKTADATYTYAFNDWVLLSGTEGANDTVGTTNLVYKATYTPTYIDYELTTSADANSTISAGETYHYSETATSTATFSAKEGHSITSVTVDGTALTGTVLANAIADGEVTVDNKGDHSVAVATTINNYTLTTTHDANSTILAGTTYDYHATETIDVTFAANTGHHITSVTVDGTALTGDDLTAAIAAGKVTVDKKDDHSVAVTSEVSSYKLTVKYETIYGKKVFSTVKEMKAYDSDYTITAPSDPTGYKLHPGQESKLSGKMPANDLEITIIYDEVFYLEANSDDTLTYNGGAQTVSGYTVSTGMPSTASISGTTASRTETDVLRDASDKVISYEVTFTDDAGGIKVTDTDKSLGNNGDVTDYFIFIKRNGSMTINPIDAAVEITEKSDNVDYNAKEQSLSGYTVTSISTPLYTGADFSFTGDADTVTAKGTNAGTYELGYTAADFTNNNKNFENVTFDVTDGQLVIDRIDMTVKADDKTKYETQPDPKFTATETGIIDIFVPVYTLDRVPGETVGTYTITPSGDAIQGNYNVKYETGTLTISNGIMGLTIHYVYAATGAEAAPDHNEALFIGSTYSVTSPTIAGYTPDRTLVSGTITSGTVITVYYTGETPPVTPVAYSYTVNYLDAADNSVIRTASTKTAALADVINAADEVVEIEGYTYSSASADTLTITATGNTLTLYYTANGETPVIIDDPTTPEAGGRSWALVNLITTILAGLGSVWMLFKNKKDKEDEFRDKDEQEKDEKRIKRSKWASAIDAIAMIIAFILTEDMSNPMILVDRWTILMVVLFVAQAAILYFGRKKSEKEEEETA